MVPKRKRNELQTHLWLPQQNVWEKLPQPNRVRCRQLLGQMLQAVAAAQPQNGRPDERED
jgi:hypothetical protein